MTDAFDRLSRFPRAPLQTAATPLDRLDHLSNHLGIDLWVKRDDLTGLGFGGNKIRQLEYYFGAALAEASDTILITGAVQSNYVRAAAAAAAKLGLRAILQLEDRVTGMDATYARSGNVLLGQLLGAEHMFYTEGEDEAGADSNLRNRAEQLRLEGRRPYVIPLGLGNPPLGALGYMRAAQEIFAQGPAFDAIVVASGSGMTHTGLLAGLRALGVNIPVYGICVRRDAKAQSERIATVAQDLTTLLECELLISRDDIETWDDTLAPGYGKLGVAARHALALVAQKEGLFLDPVYTAKSFAGVLGLLEQGRLDRRDRLLFVHTGGGPAIFAYQHALSE